MRYKQHILPGRDGVALERRRDINCQNTCRIHVSNRLYSIRQGGRRYEMKGSEAGRKRLLVNSIRQ